MTYSIVAKIPETNEIGIAVASRFFACGSLVPYITQDIVVASQAFVNPLWGLRSISMLTEGITFKEALSILKSEDEGREARQFHGISANGEIVQHTGSKCVDWAGHVMDENVSVAGNMLVGPSVLKKLYKLGLKMLKNPWRNAYFARWKQAKQRVVIKEANKPLQ